MPALSLLIKPASGACNLRCKYCFYHNEQQNRKTYSYGLMSENTLEHLVKKALEYATTYCSFGFQGGEPTLCGLDFFRRVIELQKKYNVHHTTIANVIQTNGILIDNEWARFLHENHFLVGLSLDGTKDVHDWNRLDLKGKGTFNRVLRAAQKLTAYQVDFNLLTVVTDHTADNIAKIYSFYRRSGLLYQQYIPCLEPLEGRRDSSAFALTPKKYAQFLKTLFDLWYRDVIEGRFIFIRYFENLFALLLGQAPESCGLREQCAIQNVVEADGSVYPCDFYCLDEWRLGDIKEKEFAELAKSSTAQRFLATGTVRHEQCRKCEYVSICQSGCRRYREPLEIGSNCFCQAYKDFFAHALPRLRKLAQGLQR